MTDGSQTFTSRVNERTYKHMTTFMYYDEHKKVWFSAIIIYIHGFKNTLVYKLYEELWARTCPIMNKASEVTGKC